MRRQRFGLLVCFGAGVGATVLVQRTVTNGRESRLLAPADQFWPPVSSDVVSSEGEGAGKGASGHQPGLVGPGPECGEGGATRPRQLAGATGALASTTFSIELPVGRLPRPETGGPVTRVMGVGTTPNDGRAGVAPDGKRPPSRA